MEDGTQQYVWSTTHGEVMGIMPEALRPMVAEVRQYPERTSPDSFVREASTSPEGEQSDSWDTSTSPAGEHIVHVPVIQTQEGFVQRPVETTVEVPKFFT